MWKESDHWKNWRRRWFVLAGGMFEYAHSDDPSTPRMPIPLRNATIGPTKAPRDRPYCFQLTVTEPGGGVAIKKIVLAAESAVEEREWTDAIRANIAAGDLEARSNDTFEIAAHGTDTVSLFLTNPPAPTPTVSTPNQACKLQFGYQCMTCSELFRVASRNDAIVCIKCGGKFIIETD